MMKGLKAVFCHVNEPSFGKLLRMGLVARGTNLVTGGLELSVPPGRGEWLELGSIASGQ